MYNQLTFEKNNNNFQIQKKKINYIKNEITLPLFHGAALNVEINKHRQHNRKPPTKPMSRATQYK